MQSSNYDKYHVILVEPSESLNIGFVARAMKNTGFKNLSLVAPRNFQEKRAKITACWADNLIDNIIIFETLEEALSDMNDVVGFSIREPKNRATPIFLPDWISDETNHTKNNIALLFGPEDTGLRAEHTELCRTTIQIPCSPDYTSFNLSHAVAIALYSIQINIQKFERSTENAEPPATWHDLVQFDKLLNSVMDKSHFQHEDSPEGIAGLVRNMIKRINPTDRELKVLLGLFGRIDRKFNRLLASKDIETTR